MIAWGFEYGPGGNKNGTKDFLNRLTAADVPTAWKGTDDAGLCYQAQQTGHPDSILIYRTSTAGQKDGNDYDVPRYELPPSEAAQAHWQITRAKWPPELLPARVFMEPVNEIRAKPDADKPTWGGLHPVDWIGRFMVEYAQIANGQGFKVCGPAFNSGEPEPADYSQPGMLDWLRYCAENPTKAALSVHEYSFDLLPYGNSYPYKYGRFQAAIAAADKAGIPRTFPIFITEFGWTLNTVPKWETAVATIREYSLLSARFPQLKAAAIWSLRSGWGNIDNELAAWISADGNPFANWCINNQYPDTQQPQPTAPEFGATLPEQPGNGQGGEPVTTYKNLGRAATDKRSGATHTRIAFFKTESQGGGKTLRTWIANTDYFEIPEGANEFSLVQFEATEETEPPPNPNPPPVVTALPQGSIGVDVSYWQGAYNWNDSGAKFGIIRCSDGMIANSTTHDENGIDRQFWANASKLTALGIPWGVYHFLRPGSIQAQADKVRGALLQLATNGTPTKTAVFDDGSYLPELFIDVEDGALTNQHVLDFYNALSFDFTIGIYTGKPVWELITAGAAVWWADVPLWIAAYGVNDGSVPDWPNGPNLPRGWSKAHLWQYTSNPLDKNIVGPYPPENKPTPPTPPTGKTVNFAPYLMPPSDVGQWLVFAKASGGTVDHQTQVKNGIVYIVKSAAAGKTNYEELRINGSFIERRYDTSPKDGYPYKLDDGNGWSKWLPLEMTEGEYYLRQPTVTRYDVAQNCQQISSAVSKSYIKFHKYHDSFMLPNGRTYPGVVELHWQWTPNGAVLERYYLAVGRFYIQWGDAESLHYVEDEPQGRQPMKLEPIGCLQ